MKRGRPFEPGNKYGQGRPKGSPNKKKPLVEKIFDESAPAIMALAINTAREDRQMLRTLLGQVGRRMGDHRVKLGKMPMRTFQDLDRASESILHQVTGGKLSISEGMDVCTMIEVRRHVLMDVEMEQRVSALEHPGQKRKEAA
jgi:hypothetical protein